MEGQKAISVPKVYSAISNVSKALSLTGISKEKMDKKVQYGAPDYAFRGIDKVYNALSPALVSHKLVILPKFINRQVTERTSAKGNAIFYVTVTGIFDFISTEDGSKHTVETIGEAMDSGDKATNKAMSIAYKYACFQAFCIPTEEANIDDPDTDLHIIKPIQTHKPILKKGTKEWDRAIKSLKDNGSLSAVEEHMTISDEEKAELYKLAEISDEPF